MNTKRSTSSFSRRIHRRIRGRNRVRRNWIDLPPCTEDTAFTEGVARSVRSAVIYYAIFTGVSILYSFFLVFDHLSRTSFPHGSEGGIVESLIHLSERVVMFSPICISLGLVWFSSEITAWILKKTGEPSKSFSYLLVMLLAFLGFHFAVSSLWNGISSLAFVIRTVCEVVDGSERLEAIFTWTAFSLVLTSFWIFAGVCMICFASRIVRFFDRIIEL